MPRLDHGLWAAVSICAASCRAAICLWLMLCAGRAVLACKLQQALHTAPQKQQCPLRPMLQSTAAPKKQSQL